jgi:hypothetical protein
MYAHYTYSSLVSLTFPILNGSAEIMQNFLIQSLVTFFDLHDNMRHNNGKRVTPSTEVHVHVVCSLFAFLLILNGFERCAISVHQPIGCSRFASDCSLMENRCCLTLDIEVL